MISTDTYRLIIRESLQTLLQTFYQINSYKKLLQNNIGENLQNNYKLLLGNHCK